MMCVKSSSLRWCPSILMEGRTAGGGTASTWQIIQSGRENVGLNPMNDTSSSLILRNTLSTMSGVSCMFIFLASSSLMPLMPSLSHSAMSVAKFSFFIFLGMRHPQPSSFSSPQRLTLLATPNT